MSTSIEPGAAASRPGLSALPGRAPSCGARWVPSCGARRAPSCGARTRAGGSCLGAAMANGRCRMHGGASTGPRTAEGLARMVAAKTTHGRFAMSGAPQRLAQRFSWTFMMRARLTFEATMLREYLPAGMAARLDTVPAELMPPKHPSQVAFEAMLPLTPSNCLPVGLGRRARVVRARLGFGGRVVDGAAVVLRGRAAERVAMAAETAAQAPWRAAIVAARELKLAVQEARGQIGEVRNDPIRGSAMPAGGPNSGGAQRPCTRHGRPNWEPTQRPYTRHGARWHGTLRTDLAGAAGLDFPADAVCRVLDYRAADRRHRQSQHLHPNQADLDYRRPALARCAAVPCRPEAAD